MRFIFPGVARRALICLLFVAPQVWSHPGRLDARGGHIDRSTGEYHYHRMGQAVPDHVRVNIRFKGVKDSERLQRIEDYFRAGNAGVIYYQGGKTVRDVSGSQRRRILERDGGKCIACGKEYNLEVDHTRALMNGGNNASTNLATLCHECHRVKTRMDSSLRRKRQRLYRKSVALQVPTN